MSDSHHRVIVERRLLADRRRGFDRRIVERRFGTGTVDVDRRSRSDRRSAERRNPLPRRGWLDRRGSASLTP